MRYQFKEPEEEFRFHYNNSRTRFSIVIGFLKNPFSVPFLYHFLSQPQQRKTDCFRMDFVALSLYSLAQWLTL